MLPKRLGWMLLALVASGSLAFGQERPREPYDLLIRGGKIVAGTGNPGFDGTPVLVSGKSAELTE